MRAFGDRQVKVGASRAAAERSPSANLELPIREGKLAAMRSMAQSVQWTTSC
jgi:hypothetical protein